AINLHRAAGVITKKWMGKIPRDPEALRALPGIGRYTAGAVASIAFGIRAPILDGNVRRVLCRLFEIRTDPRTPPAQDKLWALAEGMLPEKRAGDFNQAMMELGATICLPRKPECPVCPVRGVCGAYRLGVQDEIPARAAAKKIPHLQTVVALIQNNGALLSGPRPAGGLLGGLWSFPEMDWEDGAGVRRRIREITGLRTVPVRALAPVAHQFSHKHVTYRPLVFDCVSTETRPAPPWKWIAIEKIPDYPLPRAAQKILGQLDHADDLPLAADPDHPYHRIGGKR
ncbi:MAG TPA: NUDIX domain-containing protein, partial [Nitrospiria bacterium]